MSREDGLRMEMGTFRGLTNLLLLERVGNHTSPGIKYSGMK